MKNITVRKITAKDLVQISIWWLQHNEIPPSISQLPNNGLGGYIVEKNNKPIAATFLYLTNSSVAYVANAISNKEYKGKDRFEIIRLLLDSCEKEALEKGCDFMWCTSSSKGVEERCLKSGYKLVQKGQNIMAKNI